MQKEIRRIESKSLRFLVSLMDVYRDEENRELPAFDKLDMDDDLTEDFTAMLVALHVLFKQMTGSDTDLIDFTHVLNKLAVQYIFGDREESTNEEDN